MFKVPKKIVQRMTQIAVAVMGLLERHSDV